MSTILTERDALLRAVCERPEDDVPRLIWADYLEEQGDDARAEFIRCQVEIAGITSHLQSDEDCGCEWCKRGVYLQCREWELLGAHGIQWYQDFSNPFDLGRGVERYAWQYRIWGSPLGWCRFRRGFVERVECTCEWLMKHGPEVVRRTPVTEVVITDKRPYPSSDGYWFMVDLGGDAPHLLPASVWTKMVEYPAFQCRFESEQIALSTLNSACLTWAREEAKL